MQQCSLTKSRIRQELAGFSESYFYEFGLNRKLCSGIEHISNSGDFSGRDAMRILNKWVKTNCSEAGYKELQTLAAKFTSDRNFSADFQGIWTSW